MASNPNLEKCDENTNENIKMVLLGLPPPPFPLNPFFLVLEENDKSTNDNIDPPT